MPRLSYGLGAYQPGEFDLLHAAGSGIVTTSSVPALFGQSRWAGRYAVAAHIAGRVPLDGGDSPLAARGRRLEPVAAEMLEEQGWQVLRSARGIYAWHPRMAKFMASPDALARRDRAEKYRVTEIKVVAEPIFKVDWADGPPLEVELQHQAQLACTGAEIGLIVVLIVGTFRLDLVIYETVRNPRAIALIEAEVADLIELLADGELPEPDGHASAAAVLRALHPIQPGMEIVLEDDEADEAAERFDAWEQASAERRAAEKTEAASKAWFLAAAKSAARVMIDDRRWCELKDVDRAGYTVEPTTYRQVKLKRAK